ncbi:NAD(P)/FAD-dependent oxidoreductase [Niameybacter massiliensis]|uniref:NAD(P)/FAD-dependent oxidoreductase n=1 Tax=Niameybacter massiliensis TaxID=1658108 RepID=UPI0006B593CE|nr:FAD-dependent oxidoreductase [Niameybacter massiliensis]
MKYVVIGASAAGISGAKRLRELDPQAEITLISKDEHIYSRCIMHHYIEGIRDLNRLQFVPSNFIATYNINWIKGECVTQVDTTAQSVTTDKGTVVNFDKLLIATGSHVFFPPIPGLKEAKNAIGFHDLDECEAIMEQAKTANHIVVMGAGLVGIDAVSGLLHYNKPISIVEMRDRMLGLQLDPVAASTYEKAFDKKGVKQFYNLGVKELHLNDQNEITSITLSNDEELPCDLLIVASGVRSNVEFLEGSDIETDRFGLIIDALGQTSNPNVYGAGDVTGRNPIWPVAVKEGIVAASNMTGLAKEMTDFFASKSTMNFLDIPTLSLGLTHPENPDDYIIETEQDDQGNYKKIVHKDGKIYGAILQGNLDYSGVLTQLIRYQIDVSKVKKPLFEIDYSDFFNVTENFEFTYENQ